MSKSKLLAVLGRALEPVEQGAGVDLGQADEHRQARVTEMNRVIPSVASWIVGRVGESGPHTRLMDQNETLVAEWFV